MSPAEAALKAIRSYPEVSDVSAVGPSGGSTSSRQATSPRRDRASGRVFFAAVAGAVAMYFFDPKSGNGRRARLAERSLSTVRHTSARARRTARHLATEVIGRVQRRIHRHPYHAPDERTFLDHVETELFRDSQVPKGRINLDVEDGVLVLRGQLDNPQQIALVEERVFAIPGVEGVASLLHLPGTPAPNKASAIRAKPADLRPAH